MAFKDILRKQRQSGSGLMSSLAGASGASARESIDIRNYLFTKDSLLGALFPNVKGFKADNKAGRTKTSPTSLGSNSASIQLTDAKLDLIGQNTKIAAKNSMAMPAIARDMNVMRQNVVKLVKLSGGKPSTKADMFFAKAFEREKAYESQLQDSKTPTRVESSGDSSPSSKRDSGTGPLGFLNSFLNLLLVVIGAGLLLYFTSDRFRNFIDEQFKSFSGVISSMLEPFSGADSTFILMISNIVSQLGKFGSAISPILRKLGLLGTALTVIQGKAEANEAERIREKKNSGEELTEQEQKTLDDWNKKTDFSRQTEDLENLMNSGDEPSALGNWLRKTMRMGVGAGDEALKSTPAPAPSVAPTPMPPVVGMEAGRGTNRAPTPAPSTSSTTKGLLDIIAKGESGAAGYNAMNQGGNKQTGIIGSGHSEKVIGKKLTEMTVGEILERGKLPLRHENRIFAAGRYQIIPETLRGLVDQGFASLNDKFDESTQDKLGSALIQQSGALKYAEQGNLIEAQNRLSKIWAAIPSATTGQTALGGPNKADPRLGNLIQASLRAPGSQIASASTAAESARMAAMAPSTLLPAMANMTSPKTRSPQAQQVTIPSTIDSDLFDALVARATEFA
jgi:hypothetical protein